MAFSDDQPASADHPRSATTSEAGTPGTDTGSDTASDSTADLVVTGRRRLRTAGRRLSVMACLAVIAGAFVVAGVLAGLIWSGLGTRSGPIEAIMGRGEPLVLGQSAAAAMFAMDGWFAVVGAVSGSVLGTTLFLVIRRLAWWLPVGLTVGGLLGAVVAFSVGTFAANDAVILAWEPQAEQGTTLSAPLTLHAYSVLAVWPVAALVPVLVLAWLVRPEDQRVDVQASGSDPA